MLYRAARLYSLRPVVAARRCRCAREWRRDLLRTVSARRISTCARSRRTLRRVGRFRFLLYSTEFDELGVHVALTSDWKEGGIVAREDGSRWRVVRGAPLFEFGGAYEAMLVVEPTFRRRVSA